ncbi:MAG TPA: DNA-formamidopyrimidine glycosylase family protein [Acidimicrobiales bacterium]|nr:DNA-formamidopyrimidine glycosylase family protein [Acidimicrobiales bacterium]
MPEGDTIFRAAKTLDRWLRGREVTGARTQVDRLPAHKLVGQRVESAEARAKHLLIRFSSGAVLHTHMKMTGSWHVYRAGERWQKPASQARLVLEAGERIAVCFNAPVVELLSARGEHLHPGLVNLGPDVLRPPVDLAEVRRRAAALSPSATIGELLLAQQVVSGIGNIWRCESLFVQRLDPFTPRHQIDDGSLDELVTVASQMMQKAARPNEYVGRDFGGGMDKPWVYGRSRRPCRRCGTPIEVRSLGSPLPRAVYWCPTCQVRSRTT